MNAKVLAARERNATAYIKIKTALKKRRNVTGSEGMIRIMEEKSEDTLIVPVEVLMFLFSMGITFLEKILIFAGALWIEKCLQADLKMGILLLIVLLLVLQVEITRKRGLFSTSDILDFGLVRIGERSGQLMLEVVSTLEKGLEIEVMFADKRSFVLWLVADLMLL